MQPRRWPDVVIVVALVVLGAFGVWALWGEELGLRSDHRDEATPVRSEPGGASTT